MSRRESLHYVLLYDKNTGYTIGLTEFSDRDVAYQEFKNQAIKNFGKPNIQVNLIGAKDEAELHRVWGRFFVRSQTVVAPRLNRDGKQPL
jgi:hypothetical protein